MTLQNTIKELSVERDKYRAEARKLDDAIKLLKELVVNQGMDDALNGSRQRRNPRTPGPRYGRKTTTPLVIDQLRTGPGSPIQIAERVSVHLSDGPISAQAVYHILSDLKDAGDVSIEKIGTGRHKNWIYSLTEQGRKKYSVTIHAGEGVVE